jgi:hypothetical protein
MSSFAPAESTFFREKNKRGTIRGVDNQLEKK